MKVGMLISKLKKMKERYGNLEVVIDYDENGWWDTEKVQIVDEDFDPGESFAFINIKSSNET